MNEIINLLKHTDPANRELGFMLALSQGGVELLNKCIAADRGYLNLSYTGVTELPQELSLGDWLDLSGCTALQSLPQGLSVSNGLDLSGCTALQSLPQGLSVGGSIYLSGCTALQSLPQGLSVGGWLDLRGCTALPQELPLCAKIAGKIHWQ